MTVLTDTQVVTASGGLVELGYSQITSSYTTTTTNAGNTTTFVGPVTIVSDGSPLEVEFFCPSAANASAAGSQVIVNLVVDGAVQGYLAANYSGFANTSQSIALSGHRRITLSAGSHTIGASAWHGGAAGSLNAGSGSGSDWSPTFLRVSKIVQATQWPAVTTGTIICTSSTRPASPFAGQQIYETDTSLSYTYSGSAWVQTGNIGAWTTFTPQLRTGTTNVTSTNNYGRYTIVGKTVTAQAKVTATAVGTASGVLKISIPTGVATQGGEAAIGSYLVKDTGTAYYTGVALFEEVGYVSGQAYGGGGTMGANTPAMTIAVGDVVSYSVVYEIA